MNYFEISMITLVIYKEDNYLMSIFQFPLGSFMVKGTDIIAVFHGITNEGELKFLQLLRHESEELRKLFESENNPGNKGKLDSSELAEDKKKKVMLLH